MEWTAAAITMIVILTLALGRTIMDRAWPKAIGVLLLISVIAIPIMLSKQTTTTTETMPVALNTEDIQSAAVIVDTSFVPARIRFKAGSPAKLIFLRETERECNATVVFPALNRSVELPLGEHVTVDLDTVNMKRLEFTCGRRKMTGVIDFAT